MLTLSPTRRTTWKWLGWPGFKAGGGAVRAAGAASSMGSFTLRSLSSISSHLDILFLMQMLTCQVSTCCPWASTGVDPVLRGDSINVHALMSTLWMFLWLGPLPASSIVQRKQAATESLRAETQSLFEIIHKSYTENQCLSHIIYGMGKTNAKTKDYPLLSDARIHTIILKMWDKTTSIILCNPSNS